MIDSATSRHAETPERVAAGLPAVHSAGITAKHKEQSYMRRFKFAVTMIAVLALGAVATASASAAPEFLPGVAGTGLTSTSGKAKLQVKGGAAITCTGSAGSGEILGNTTALLVITFKGCETIGVEAHSLGDAIRVIKVHVEVGTCFTSLKPLRGGIVFEVLPVHIEAPTAKLLVVVTGAFVAEVPAAEENVLQGFLKPVIKQASGVQAIDGCRDAANLLVELTLLAEENESGVNKQSGEEATSFEVKYTAEQEFMA